MYDPYAAPIVPIDVESSARDTAKSTDTPESRVTDDGRPRSTPAEFGAPLVPVTDERGETPALSDEDDAAVWGANPVETPEITEYEREQEEILPAVGTLRLSH